MNSLWPKKASSSHPKSHSHLFHTVTLAVLMPILIAACGTPGIPSVKFTTESSPSQTACREYAQAFFGTTRESVTSALEAARNKLVTQEQGDSAATSLVTAIDDVLVNSVVGTNDSFLAANQRVINLCGQIGVNITME